MAGHSYTSLKSVNDPFQGPSKYQVCHLVAHKRSSFQLASWKSAAGHVLGKLNRMALLSQRASPVTSYHVHGAHRNSTVKRGLPGNILGARKSFNCVWPAAAEENTMRIRLEEKCSLRHLRKKVLAYENKGSGQRWTSEHRQAEQRVPLHPVQVNGSHLCSNLKGNHGAESQS